MTKHTQAPWERHYETKTCKQSKKTWRVDYITKTNKNHYGGGIYLDYIAEINGQCDNNTGKNARLIAAAPELLDALIEASIEYRALKDKYDLSQGNCTGNDDSAINLMRYVIAKAKGE